MKDTAQDKNLAEPRMCEAGTQKVTSGRVYIVSRNRARRSFLHKCDLIVFHVLERQWQQDHQQHNTCGCGTCSEAIPYIRLKLVANIACFWKESRQNQIWSR